MVWTLFDPALNAYAGSSGHWGVAWPFLGQVLRVERRRTPVRCGVAVGPTEVEVTPYITSALPPRAGVERLMEHLRWHWRIENGLHWCRDMDWDEDRSQVRSGAAPEVMAAGRNLALGLLRHQGHTNLAAALRTFAGRPRAAVQLVLAAGLE